MTYCWVIVDAPWVRVALRVGERGPDDALGVDALVAVEGAVLRGDGGVLHRLRDVGQRDRLAGSAPRTGRSCPCRPSSRRSWTGPRRPCWRRGSRCCGRRSSRCRPGSPRTTSPKISSHFSTFRTRCRCCRRPSRTPCAALGSVAACPCSAALLAVLLGGAGPVGLLLRRGIAAVAAHYTLFRSATRLSELRTRSADEGYGVSPLRQDSMTEGGRPTRIRYIDAIG